jgi:hypothetical protein
MIATQADPISELGELINGYAEGPAGNTQCDLIVPQGYIYQILFAKGRHSDNTAARVCHFEILDLLGGVVSLGSKSITNSESIPLYINDPSTNPLTTPFNLGWTGSYFLTYGSTIRFTVAAIAAGKQAFIDYVVRRIRGVEYWG